MAFALGEDRHKHIRAGHLLAPGRLHVNDRALDHALEAGRWLRIVGAIHDQIVELAVDVFDEVPLQSVDVDIACAHHRRGVLIVGQRQQQMFERRVLVVPLIGERQRTVQRLLKATRKGRHQMFVPSEQIISFPSRIVKDVDACGRSP
jgi:hypothetical protein